MRFDVEVEREDDGRWVADVPSVPGAMAYGSTRAEAASRAGTVVLMTLAGRLWHHEPVPELEGVFSVVE